MLREERINQIVEQLERDGSVNVLSLKDKFNVSDMTIRRDLKILEDRGIVERIHGGALLSKKGKNRIEPPIIERLSLMADEKKRIGESVAKLIAEGETIFLGSGTTTIYVARELIIRDDITVVTNSVPILHELASNSKMNVITVGGFLRRSELSLIGAFAEAVLRDIRVNKVIIGMRGIHPLYGFTCEHPEELMTDRRIFEISDDIIVVADHTKIGQVATNKVVPIDRAKIIVTSSNAPPDVVENIQVRGVEVVLV
jgi:DeoR/GlpR family transcriptional regulator of sugar metabolism